MMLFHLVKKDFLIVKKYVLFMLAAAVLIPPVMLWRTPEYGGTMGFILSVIFSVFMLLQYVSLKEYQCPKAAALLCAAPFPRKLLVVSKYVFCMLVYLACCLIFSVETLLFPRLGTFHAEIFAQMFLLTALFISLYLPVQYKLGYEKTKFVFVVVIMASPVIFALLLKREMVPADILAASPLLVGGMVLTGVLCLAVSACLSVSFFKRTDLV